MNIELLFSPREVKKLPLKSVERTIAQCSLRMFWHRVFDPCSKLRESTNNNTIFFEDFMEWANANDINFDWKTHLYLLKWTRNSDRYLRLNEELYIEILAASAQRWCVSDFSKDISIFVYTPLLPYNAIWARKNISTYEGPKCKLISFDKPLIISKEAHQSSDNRDIFLSDAWQEI